MFEIVDLQHAKFVCTCTLMIVLVTFHVLSFNYSLIIAIKSKAKRKCPHGHHAVFIT
jgi:hypothetical protein